MVEKSEQQGYGCEGCGSWACDGSCDCWYSEGGQGGCRHERGLDGGGTTEEVGR
jgi:hypothetical protein